METTNIVDFARRDEMTELLKTGAQALIASAVEAELAGYMAQYSERRTEAGHAAVVRNGHHPARPFQTGIGPVSVRIPKARSKYRHTGDILVCAGAPPLRTPHEDVGSGLAMALPQRDLQRRDGSRPQGSSGSRCRWLVV